MSRSYSFAVDLDGFVLEGHPEISLVRIESKGKDLSDFLENAECFFEDWHGNVVCERWGLGDLPSSDFALIERKFAEFLSSAAEAEAERGKP